ncbi:MAG: hypothetical protein NC541_02400 [bacterium]|nr:hypothetical protein [bacterium]
MNKNILFLAFNDLDDDILERSEADTCGSKKKTGRLRWGTMAACLGLIFTLAMMTLPNILKDQNNIVPTPDPDVPEPVTSDDDGQHSADPFPSPTENDGSQACVDSLPPPAEKNIIINWDGVTVNESNGPGPDAVRLYLDPELYDKESMGEDEVLVYYGWNLAPAYIPEGLTGGGNAPGGYLVREKATGEVIEDQAGRGFWVDFWEDGSPKSNDDLYIPAGFTVRASRLGILHCALLPADEEHTTDFGGVSVTITHCSMKHGPFDPTQKAPDGLSNMPAGYYDIYVASFILDGIEYEVEAQRLELEEVIKIVASVINMPYSEDFTVGAPQSLPDRDTPSEEYSDTVIAPGFNLNEPAEPDES